MPKHVVITYVIYIYVYISVHQIDVLDSRYTAILMEVNICHSRSSQYVESAQIISFKKEEVVTVR